MAILDNRAPSKFMPFFKKLQQRYLKLLQLILLLAICIYCLAQVRINGERLQIVSYFLDVNGRIAQTIANSRDAIFQSYQDISIYFVSAKTQSRENDRLKEELSLLTHQLDKLSLSFYEYMQLKQQLNYYTADSNIVAMARMSFLSHQPYFDNAIISIGDIQGAQLNQVVLSNEKLLGRIIDVGTNFARVLLVTDANSRVPVELVDSKQKAILSGTGTGKLELLYINDVTQVRIGELVITSGDGRFYPRGIIVARVDAVIEGRIFAQMVANLREVGIVAVMERPSHEFDEKDN